MRELRLEHRALQVRLLQVLDLSPVRIGSFTLFGPAVQIYTAMHPLNVEPGTPAVSFENSRRDGPPRHLLKCS